MSSNPNAPRTLDRLLAWTNRVHLQVSAWLAESSWRHITLLMVLALFAKILVGSFLHFSFLTRFGDPVAALMLMAFFYVVATKLIISKTAESTAQAKTANDLAESETMARQLVQARLKLMQAQIEPHFLFNTLAAIDYLIETAPARASVMQKTLIAYLRAALPQMREGSSQLGRELGLIRPYLELLKMRIEDRLEFELAVPKGLHSAIFPPMMLQTLVENAIQHGIEPKPEGGRLTVSAEINDGKLWVEVEDSGAGMSEDPTGKRGLDKANGQPTQHGGLGLANIRDRLSMLYPGQSRLDLLPSATGGTLARIVIPYQVGSAMSGASTSAAAAAAASA